MWEFTLDHAVSMTGFDLAGFQVILQRDFLDEFIGGPLGARSVFLSPPQQAVVNVLMTATGGEPPSIKAQVMGTRSPKVVAEFAAAGHRFAALSPAARHAWLLTHLSALRAGRITLAQIP